MSDKDSENKSASVPDGAKQTEKIHGRWLWVERSVWSERMLQALAPAISMRNHLSGEPDAGKPPVRFGGRGEVLSLVPTPILSALRFDGFGPPEKSETRTGPLSFEDFGS